MATKCVVLMSYLEGAVNLKKHMFVVINTMSEVPMHAGDYKF